MHLGRLMFVEHQIMSLLRKVLNVKITTKTQIHKKHKMQIFNKIQFCEIWCFRAFVVK